MHFHLAACHAPSSCHPCVCAGTSIGLPELQLGIIPGFGGTQRLPRAVGLAKAVEMMLTSRPVKDKAALSLGLVDAVVPLEQLMLVAQRTALEIAGWWLSASFTSTGVAR